MDKCEMAPFSCVGSIWFQGATVDENVTSSSGSDNKGVARPIPAKSSKTKDRSKVKAKSLPIDINFKSKSTATA